MPLVVAHRGASEDWPEHTLAAFAAAVADGADAVECDVRLSADGVPVCVHDERVDRTSDGAGAVSRLTLAELRALDWGSWHPSVVDAGLGRPPADARRLVTLAELVEFLVAAPRPVGLLVETKHPSAGGRLERRVLDIVEPVRDSLPLVGGMSFWPPAVRRFAALTRERTGAEDPAVRPIVTVRLVASRRPLPGRTRPDAVGLDIALVRRRPAAVEAVRGAGRAVYVWTVDEPDDVRLCLDLHADAIITNRPRQVRDLVRGILPR